jgi:hypothetical protein
MGGGPGEISLDPHPSNCRTKKQTSYRRSYCELRHCRNQPCIGCLADDFSRWFGCDIFVLLEDRGLARYSNVLSIIV